MNNKPTLLFQAPIATRSGYGERSRDLLRALIELDKFDIKVISTRWGATPLNALNANDPNDQEIIKRLHFGQLQQQPDIFMQVTIPNEFMPRSGLITKVYTICVRNALKRLQHAGRPSSHLVAPALV